MGARRLLQRWRGRGGSSPFPPPPAVAHPQDEHRAVLAAARALPDDAIADEALLAALAAEIALRRTATATLDGPASPRVTQLRVRRRGVPDWWEGGGNLLLCAPDVVGVSLVRGLAPRPRTGVIVVAGAGSAIPELVFDGARGLAVFGDGVRMPHSHFGLGDDATVLVGEHSTAAGRCSAGIRNGGIVIVGDDNMWADRVDLMTDDSHAIRDEATGARLNVFGGRIVVERHVWLANDVVLMGDCLVGRNGVVGVGSLVKGRRLPPGAVSVGRPARPTRTGVTWSRDDVA